jgi:hypothetical protein
MVIQAVVDDCLVTYSASPDMTKIGACGKSGKWIKIRWKKIG